MEDSKQELRQKLKEQLRTKKLQRNTNDTQRKVLKKKMPDDMVDSCMNYMKQKNVNLGPIVEQLKKTSEEIKEEKKEPINQDQILRILKEIQTHPEKKKQLVELMKTMVPPEQLEQLLRLLN
jgi:predicted  nucleic acid-binding Zn-ribbon protein